MSKISTSNNVSGAENTYKFLVLRIQVSWVFLMRCLRATPHTRVKAPDHGNVRVLIGRKGETIQVHFTLGGEGLKVQRKVCG